MSLALVSRRLCPSLSLITAETDQINQGGRGTENTEREKLVKQVNQRLESEPDTVSDFS